MNDGPDDLGQRLERFSLAKNASPIDDVPEGSVRPMSGTCCGRRYYAAVVDNIGAVVLALTGPHFLPIEHDLTRGLSLYAFYLLYYAASEGLFATSPGKWYFGLRIVDAHGQRCRARQAILRTLGRILDMNPLFLGGLPAALLVRFTPGRQHLGDFFAGTYVVRVEDFPRP